MYRPSVIRKIIAYLEDGAATTDELAEALGVKPNILRARLSTMKKLGAVRPLGRVPNNGCRVWELRS
jgi:Mn-dependent DtxR family transcriptional regulator